MRTLTAAILLLGLAISVGSCADCPTSCQNSYENCLEDPSTEPIQCDIGYDQCLVSCGLGVEALPDAN